MLRKLPVCLGLVMLVGCASPPVEPPSLIGKPSQGVRVVLKARGKVVVAQELHKNVRNRKCSDFSKNFRVTLQKVGANTRFPVHASCRLINGNLAVSPRNFLPEGEYRVQVERHQPWKYFAGDPRLLVHYVNADFASETDQVWGGAQTVAKGSKIEGDVNYSAGDRTDWYQMDGESGVISLTLLGEKSSSELTASVYRRDVGQPKLKKLTDLRHAKAVKFRLSKGDLYVRVAGNRYSGASKYTILRRDFPVTRLISVPVIDSYRVSDSTSMLLLEAVDGIKVEDQLSVRGKKIDGEVVSLGECLVTSVGDGQASCRLPSVPKVNIVELRAQARIQG